LFDAVVESIASIERQPEIGAALYSDPQTRRVLVVRYPYQVVYRLEENEIVVVAIAHLKRRPGYWKHRS
jgi:plasmid stabilization system protein ParE